MPVEQAIAAAESAGLVNEVTLWLVNGALRNCREFRDAAGLDPARVALPVGREQAREGRDEVDAAVVFHGAGKRFDIG